MRTQKRRIAEESPNCCKLGVHCTQNVFLVLSYRKEQVRTMIKSSKVRQNVPSMVESVAKHARRTYLFPGQRARALHHTTASLMNIYRWPCQWHVRHETSRLYELVLTFAARVADTEQQSKASTRPTLPGISNTKSGENRPCDALLASLLTEQM